MGLPYLVLLAAVALLLALLLQIPARWLHLPLGSLLVLLGFGASEVLVAAGFDLGLRWENFHQIVFFILIPVLLFESALRLDWHALARDAVPIFLLAIPLMLLSTGVIAGCLYYAIGHPAGFPWSTALLAGLLLSATDPAAVEELLRSTTIPGRVILLLEGESLFNDAMAIVGFSVLLGLALGGMTEVGPVATGIALGSEFLEVFFGGLAVGLVTGWAAGRLLEDFPARHEQVLITLASAYIAYVLAEMVLGFSGVMAVLGCGSLLGRRLKRNHWQAPEFTTRFWSVLAFIASVLVFLLAGATFTLAMFQDRWLAMLLGVGAVILARSLIIHGGLGLSQLLGLPGRGLDGRELLLLNWGGVRGTVTLALVLSLPLEVEGWYTVQSMAYGVVLFALLIQAPTLWRLSRS